MFYMYLNCVALKIWIIHQVFQVVPLVLLSVQVLLKGFRIFHLAYNPLCFHPEQSPNTLPAMPHERARFIKPSQDPPGVVYSHRLSGLDYSWHGPMLVPFQLGCGSLQVLLWQQEDILKFNHIDTLLSRDHKFLNQTYLKPNLTRSCLFATMLWEKEGEKIRKKKKKRNCIWWG